MRRALAVGLSVAFVAAANPHPVGADPSVPQVNPIHLQREDAQRLRDQQRGLDDAAPVPAPAASAPGASGAPVGAARQAPPVPEVHSGRAQKAVGVVLVGVGALSALISLPLLVASSGTSSDPAIQSVNDSYDTAGKVFLVTALVAGITGVVLISTSKASVQLVPVATSSSAGLAIMGRM